MEQGSLSAWGKNRVDGANVSFSRGPFVYEKLLGDQILPFIEFYVFHFCNYRWQLVVRCCSLLLLHYSHLKKVLSSH